MQNTFMDALRYVEKFFGLSKPCTWLFGIELKLARNQVRPNLAQRCEAVDETAHEQLVDMHSDPAVLIKLRQLALKVDIKLNDLPSGIRATFEAVREGESTNEEAVQKLDLPVGAVRSRVSRVRAEYA